MEGTRDENEERKRCKENREANASQVQGGSCPYRRGHAPLRSRWTPTKAQFVKVYGARGPTMTWAQRAKAGVDAKHFQAALAEKTKG
jgi:hypothetical protein